jgi:hypothetical protein
VARLGEKHNAMSGMLMAIILSIGRYPDQHVNWVHLLPSSFELSMSASVRRVSPQAPANRSGPWQHLCPKRASSNPPILGNPHTAATTLQGRPCHDRAAERAVIVP